MQDYLDELSNRDRQAARVGRPDSAAAQGGNAVSDSGSTDSQDAVADAVQGVADAVQGVADAVQARLASPNLLRRAAEAGPESSSSVVT